MRRWRRSRPIAPNAEPHANARPTAASMWGCRLAMLDTFSAEEPSMLIPPINLHAWIEEHRHLLKPPVGNKCIQQDGFIIMIVGGPNARTDYHYDEGPEWFFQLEGEMVLKVQDDGVARDIPIRAGEIFLLPPKVPHSPQRAAGSIGIVIERVRLPHEQDGLQWYCPQCNHTLYEAMFPLKNIETDFPPVFDHFYRSLGLRTCTKCGHVHPAPERYATAEQ
ncbi:3-hydroxyanthranilate 3,4-dioxygenase [Xanthomonas vasicola]